MNRVPAAISPFFRSIRGLGRVRPAAGSGRPLAHFGRPLEPERVLCVCCKHWCDGRSA